MGSDPEGHMPYTAHDLEEAMTVIWKEIEMKRAGFESVDAKLAGCIGPGVLSELERTGMVRTGEGRAVEFTDAGYRRAYDLARRHRLTERLLVDVLGMDRAKVDTEACALEHIISKELEENICTLLGHPKVCPHGSAIMPGECCKNGLSKVERAIFPLSELTHGEKGFVAYMLTDRHPSLHKLLSLGLVPGVLISVHQTYPSYVIEFEQTQLAVEGGIAGSIFVRKAGK